MQLPLVGKKASMWLSFLSRRRRRRRSERILLLLELYWTKGMARPIKMVTRPSLNASGAKPTPCITSVEECF
jgi:hypothetical protein